MNGHCIEVSRRVNHLRIHVIFSASRVSNRYLLIQYSLSIITSAAKGDGRIYICPRRAQRLSLRMFSAKCPCWIQIWLNWREKFVKIFFKKYSPVARKRLWGMNIFIRDKKKPGRLVVSPNGGRGGGRMRSPAMKLIDSSYTKVD